MKPEFYPQPPHNPYGPDWPDANYHPDWPHYRHMHHWNDTEPAAVVPWHDECCPEPSDDCVCVTSGDVELWNTISSVSALSKIDIDGLSGLSALSGISEIMPAVSAVYENSDIWMLAQYVPNINEAISAMSAKIDTKAPLSGEYLQKVYSDPYFFEGAGTMKSVLKPSLDLLNTVSFVIESTSGEAGLFTVPLANKADFCKLNNRVTEMTNAVVEHDWAIGKLQDDISKIQSTKIDYWQCLYATPEQSLDNPDIFYYYDSKKYKK